MDYSLESLESADNPRVLFRGITGSRAYGTQNANSDTDIRGIFVAPSAEYARLNLPPKQVSDERNDRTYYSLVRFCELMSEANPTTLEMLFLPEDCILKTSSAYSLLVANRELFITQKVVDTHINYAMSQFRRARGTNKRVWNPCPEEPPRPEEYCLFLADAKGAPVPVGKTNVDLANCMISRLIGNRAGNMFALYDYGAPTGGAFRGGQPFETDVTKLDQEKRIGVLLFNEQAFNAAKKQHHEYWQWRRNRNESRWIAQERGEMDYDSKNMMHLVRILMSGENIVKTGNPLVRVEGEKLETLFAIRRGEWTFEQIMAFAEEIQKSIQNSDKDRLPSDCDRVAVDALIAEVMKEAGVA